MSTLAFVVGMEAHEARCAGLSDSSFTAFLASATPGTKSRETFVPEGAERNISLRVIKASSGMLQHGTALIAEILRNSTWRPSRRCRHLRRVLTNRRTRVRSIYASRVSFRRDVFWEPLSCGECSNILASLRPSEPPAKQCSDMTAQDQPIEATYQYVAPEIPFASLQP